jgi:hypothetical protein
LSDTERMAERIGMGRGDYLSQAGPIKASFKLRGRGGSLAGCMRVPASV